MIAARYPESVAQSDDYRAALLAAGPGALAGAVGLVAGGGGPDWPGLPATYGLVLLASVPAIPFVALVLVRWLPRGSPARPRGVLRFALLLFASVWHLLLAEIVSRVDSGGSVLARAWWPIACAAIPALAVTVFGWAAYRRVRAPRIQPPAGTSTERP